MTTSLDSYKWPLLEELIVADYFDTDFVLHTAESMFPNLKRFKYWGLMSSLLLGVTIRTPDRHLRPATPDLFRSSGGNSFDLEFRRIIVV